MDLPGASNGDQGAGSGHGSWSPPTSPFQDGPQRRFTTSRLTLASGRLAWSPVGVRIGTPGSQPFTVSVGTGADQAAELVWLCGSVIPSRSPGPQVNVVALCSRPSAAERGGARHVLGYLPIGLFAPYTGALFDVGDSREPTEQKIRAVARAAGMGYSAYSVEMGSQVNATFPGALRNAGIIQALGWIQAVLYIAFAIFVFALGASLHSGAAAIGLYVLGAIVLVIALSIVPPVARRIRQRRATKRAGLN